MARCSPRRIALREGDVIAVGRKAKGIIKLPLTVRAALTTRPSSADALGERRDEPSTREHAHGVTASERPPTLDRIAGDRTPHTASPSEPSRAASVDAERGSSESREHAVAQPASAEEASRRSDARAGRAARPARRRGRAISTGPPCATRSTRAPCARACARSSSGSRRCSIATVVRAPVRRDRATPDDRAIRVARRSMPRRRSGSSATCTATCSRWRRRSRSSRAADAESGAARVAHRLPRRPVRRRRRTGSRCCCASSSS